jgi:hypothetical protein
VGGSALAPTPQGPGYTEFIHADEAAVGFDDGLGEPGRERRWGGEYGPYLVPSWCRASEEGASLVHVLSSWNPYQVHLLEVDLARGPGPASRGKPPAGDLEPTSLPPFGEWEAEGDPFRTWQGPDGTPRLTTFTFTDRKDAAVGALRHTATVPAGAVWLCFRLRGGPVRVGSTTSVATGCASRAVAARTSG